MLAGPLDHSLRSVHGKRKLNQTSITIAAVAAASMFSAPALADLPVNVAYVTNQHGAVTVIDTTTLKPVADIAVGASPRGLAVSPDGRWLLTANLGGSDVSVVDTATRKEVKRIPVGKNVEFMRILPGGGKAFVAYEPSSKGGPANAGNDDDDDANRVPAEVAVIDLKRWQVVGRMKASPETEAIEFSPDQKRLIVANEGDNTVAVYDLATLKPLKRIDVSPYGSRPRGVKVSPDGQSYVVTLENSNNFLVLDAGFKVVKAVPTEKGPYGVAFDREGKQIWIAAARADRLQVFDARSLAPLAAIPVGKRCWHFSFTPDDEKILMACGRSNTVDVIDPVSRTVVDRLTGFKMPWGVITYPKSPGSLDAPAP